MVRKPLRLIKIVGGALNILHSVLVVKFRECFGPYAVLFVLTDQILEGHAF